jgi:hypothetical protein
MFYILALLFFINGFWLAANLFASNPLIRQRKSYLKLILTYVSFKSSAVLILIAIMPVVFGRGYFDYSDFKAYSECNFNSENSFFSILICLLDIEEISDLKAIMLALIVNTFRDLFLIFITVKHKILKSKGVLVFAVLLALHPYLAIYHVKLSTTIFASLAVSTIFYVIISSKKQSIIFDLCFIIFAGLRNTTAGIIVPYYIWEIARHSIGKNKIDYYFFKNIISLFAVLAVVMISGKYMFNFVNNANRYSLDMDFFLQHINTTSILLNQLLAFISMTISHLIALLGFREAAFTEFPDFFIPFNNVMILHILAGIILSVMHGLGFLQFLRSFLKKDKRYIILIFTLVPTLISVAHLRYFLPFIPLSMLGLAILFEDKYIYE